MAEKTHPAPASRRLGARLVILGLAFTVVAINGRSLLKTILLNRWSATLGGSVESHDLAIRLWQGRLTFDRLSAVDPVHPARNLFQIEQGEFQIHWPDLVYHRLRLKQGQLFGVQLGTPRSGRELAVEQGTDGTFAAKYFLSPPCQWSADSRRAAQRWLDSAPSSIFTDRNANDGQLLAQQLQREWDERFDELERTLNMLISTAAEVQSKLEAPNPNPLRDADYGKTLTDKLRDARKHAEELAQRIELAKQALPLAARQLSASFTPLPEHSSDLTVPQIDASLLAEIIHSDESRAWLQNAVDLVAEARASLPSLPAPLKSNPRRGRDIVFAGQRPEPGLVVDTFDLDGSILWSGKRYQFVGTIKNLSSNPQWHVEPVEIQLRAQGDTHLVIMATLDRRGSHELDSFFVRCPSISLPASVLGDGNALALAISPRRAQIELQLVVDGKTIQGQANLTFSDVALHVDRVHADLGGDDLAVLLNRHLGEINRFHTEWKFAISGETATLDIESELAEKFAIAVGESQTTLARERARQRQAEAEQRMLEAIDDLNRLFAARLTALHRQLTEQSGRLAKLAERLPFANTDVRRR